MNTALLTAALSALIAPPLSATQNLPAEKKPVGQFETVAEFYGPMLTGVTVSRTGRIFVNFPKWGDKVDYTVAELKNGRTVPYPNAALNRTDMARQSDTLVSVQSVVVDLKDRLWILDTGSPLFAPTTFGGPKLLCVNLTTNKVTQKIVFPTE